MEAICTISEADYRRMRRHAGVCTICGREDAFTMAGRAHCAECAERDRGYYQKNVDANRMRKRRSYQATDKPRREARVAAGLCPKCGRPADPPYKTCERCRSRNKAVRHERNNAPPRGSYGTCWQCNKLPAVPGKKLCPKCLEMALDHLKKGRRDNKQHPWRALNFPAAKAT